MNTMRRRPLLLGASLLPFSTARASDAAAALQALERRAGGRLGVAWLDTGNGRLQGWRLDERFALCSTFKLPLAAAVLQHPERERQIAIGPSDLLPHSPVVKARLAEKKLSALALAEATQTTSDNAAANLLLRELFGGPAGFTAWLRAQGDAVTRIDRYEPEMNRVPPGDARDTSTPAAFARLVAALCTGPLLPAPARQTLLAWMEATQTGQRRLRAGLPAGWRAGDKTGTGFSAGLPDRINDVAITWPPGRAPWVLACFYEGPQQSSDWVRPQDEAVLAEVGRLAALAAS